MLCTQQTAGVMRVYLLSVQNETSTSELRAITEQLATISDEKLALVSPL